MSESSSSLSNNKLFADIGELFLNKSLENTTTKSPFELNSTNQIENDINNNNNNQLKSTIGITQNNNLNTIIFISSSTGLIQLKYLNLSLKSQKILNPTRQPLRNKMKFVLKNFFVL